MKGKRRWLEPLKTLLIVLLSASAVYLMTMTPLIQDSGVLDLLRLGQSGSQSSTAVTLTAAAKPSRMAVNSGSGRYGVQYDQDEVDELFARFGSLLGEALVSSGQSLRISEQQWQNYLRGAGIYFDFTGDIPLSALSGWLQREGLCSLNAAARRILLVDGGEDRVLLCYQDSGDGLFYACETGLSWQLHLEPTLSGITGNGAEFAFENESAENLQPYTLMTNDSERRVYASTTPLSPDGNVTWLLEALEYTGRNHASVSGGDLYLDGNDRLRILTGGQVIYDAAQGGKYPVAMAGTEMTAAEAIEAARELAEKTIGLQCGEAELYLESVHAAENGWRVRFGYRLDGSTVWLYDEGWAAEFYILDGYITEFTLWFRNYVSTGETALLLPMDSAMLMLPDLTEEACELILQYHDRGETTVEPVWVAK